MTEEDKIEVVVDETPPSAEKPAEPAAPVAEAPAAPVQPEPKKEEYSAAVAGRIGNLTRKWRDSERIADEHARVNRALLEENERLRKRALDTDTHLVGEAEGRVDAQIGSAKKLLAEGHTAGDTEKIVEATNQLAALNAERERIVLTKNQIRPEVYQAPAPQAPQPAGPDPKAVEWAEKNPWFGKDKGMTAAAYGFHEDIVNSGVHPQSDEYYETLNARMGEYFPTKFKPSEKPVQETPARPDPAASVVAPVTRGTAGAPRQIKLTPTQVAVAKRLNVPLEVYAREFARLNEGQN